MTGNTGNASNASNIRKQVFAELDRNPLLTAKPLGKILGLSNSDYQRLKGYIRKLKCDWKRYHENERGLIRSCPDDVHNAFFTGSLDLGVSKVVREGLEEVWARAGVDRWIFPSAPQRLDGWRKTRSRNRFLLFKSVLGRIRFFETGLVELYVRKPASLGKAMQLFCDGFTKTLLVTDLVVLNGFQKSLRVRGFHAVFNTDQRLPYMKVKLFKDSNGMELTLGDRTHPNGVELVVNYLDQVEQAKNLIDELSKAFGLSRPNGVKDLGGQDYSR